MNRRDQIIFLCFVPGALLVGFPALWVPFLSDDYVLLKAIAERGALFSWADYPGFPADFYRPLTSLSLWLDWQLGSFVSSHPFPVLPRPAGFHATSLVLHGLNAGLVFLIARRLLAVIRGRRAALVRSSVPAALAGILFLTLGSHGEPVAWVAGRADLLAACFALVALLFHLALRERGGGWRLLAAAALFAAALFSKESALPLLGVFIFYDAWLLLGRRSTRRPATLLPALAVYVLVAGGYLAARTAEVGSLIGGYGAAAHLNLAPAHLAGNVARYAARSILPSFALDPDLVGLVLVLLVGVGFAGLRRWMRGSAAIAGPVDGLLVVFLGLAWLCLLAPVLSLSVSLRTTDGERFLYLASAFSSMLLIYLFLAALQMPHRFTTVVILLVCMQALGFYDACVNWQRAGVISERVLTQTSRHAAQGRVLILNLPDNLNGAFLFRNGFEEALALRGGLPSAVPAGRPAVVGVTVVARHNITAPGSRVSARRSGDQLEVRLLNGKDRFLGLEAGAPPRTGSTAAAAEADRHGAIPYAITSQSPAAYRLVLGQPEPDRILYYSEGGLTVLPGRSYPADFSIAADRVRFQ